MRRETASKSYYLGERAIVVGGGLAGLSAARALSDRFRQVVILDRDELPDSATPRPGVPQGKHPHALLGGGLEALEQLFPGFGNELGRAGAVPINRGFDMLYEIPGQDAWPRIKFGWATYAMSLSDLLGGFNSDLLSTLAHDFLTKAENLIADPWAMSALPDFIYPETTGVRPKNLEERLNFQKGLGRLAARDAAVFELLMDVRNLLKPLSVLDDPSIVGRIENEVASEWAVRDKLLAQNPAGHRRSELVTSRIQSDADC